MIDFESYDPDDETSSILSIEACCTSSIKIFLFVFASFTIIPLLAVKWSYSAYRFFLLSYTDIFHATKLIVRGPRMISTSY